MFVPVTFSFRLETEKKMPCLTLIDLVAKPDNQPFGGRENL